MLMNRRKDGGKAVIKMNWKKILKYDRRHTWKYKLSYYDENNNLTKYKKEGEFDAGSDWEAIGSAGAIAEMWIDNLQDDILESGQPVNRKEIYGGAALWKIRRMKDGGGYIEYSSYDGEEPIKDEGTKWTKNWD